MKALTENAAKLRPNPELIRRQTLFSFLTNALTMIVFFTADFPHGREIAVLTLISAVMYLVFYVFFYRIYSAFSGLYGTIVSAVGVILLAFVLHFSGGIVSPLVFLYFCILISEIIHGLENHVTLPLAVGTYLVVVVGESSGLLAPANQWAETVYNSHAVTFIFAAATIIFMAMTRYMAQIIVVNLRASLERQNQEKEALLSKFSELNATSQIGALAHRIVHDLRGPISSISGYIQVEMTRVKASDDKEMLKDLNDVVMGMAESLKGITQFGRVSGGPAEKIVLADFMRTLVAIVSYSPQARGVKFVKLYPESLKLAISASKADLQQAYFNIIRNAVEAVRDNSAGRTVEISIKAAGKEVEVSISDNGPGMDPEVLKNLFRKSITTKKDGTGIGLVITRDLLVRNEGDIEFHNLPAGGLWVLTRFPLA